MDTNVFNVGSGRARAPAVSARQEVPTSHHQAALGSHPRTAQAQSGAALEDTPPPPSAPGPAQPSFLRTRASARRPLALCFQTSLPELHFPNCRPAAARERMRQRGGALHVRGWSRRCVGSPVPPPPRRSAAVVAPGRHVRRPEGKRKVKRRRPGLGAVSPPARASPGPYHAHGLRRAGARVTGPAAAGGGRSGGAGETMPL